VVAKKTRKEPKVSALLGVGLDAADEQQRITRADDITLVGGSAETHERMQDVAIHFNESLQNRGKRLQDASLPEVFDLLQRAMDR